MDDGALWSAYQRVVFRLVDTLPRAMDCMIITADYPRGQAVDEEQRQHRAAQLYATLSLYSRLYRLYGCSADFTHCELSFAASGMMLSKALEIARDYQQNALYQVHNDRLYLHGCLMADKRRVALGAFSQRLVATT